MFVMNLETGVDRRASAATAGSIDGRLCGLSGIGCLAMSGIEPIDQPPTGFGYSYWFSCPGCRGRVEVTADLFELQCIGQAEFSVCACGTDVDVTDQSPTLRDTEDTALQNDSVARLVWYHSSRYEHWPDLTAYTAEVTAMAMQTAARFKRVIDPDRLIAEKLSLALHLGTYEATVENLLRRLEDQDRADLFDEVLAAPRRDRARPSRRFAP